MRAPAPRSLVPVGLVAFLLGSALVPGGCDCDPDPIDEIICDFTLAARDGDQHDFGSVIANAQERSTSVVIENTGNRPLNALEPAFSENGEQGLEAIPSRREGEQDEHGREVDDWDEVDDDEV